MLILVLKGSLRTYFKSVSLSWFLGSGPCPCPCPCGSGPCPCPCPGPCGLTYVFPAAILLCVYKYDVCGLALFFYYNTSLVFHLESSNEKIGRASCRER